MSGKLDDKHILNLLKSGKSAERSKAMTLLCHSAELFSIAKKAVSDSGGSNLDMEDVFQEGLMILVKNITNGKFRQESQISTYFFTICKWRYLKKYSIKYNPIEDSKIAKRQVDEIEQIIIQDERKLELKELVNTLVAGMKGKCAEVLSLHKLNIPLSEIAAELGYDKIQSLKNQIGRCRQKLRDLITSNPKLYNSIQSLR